MDLDSLANKIKSAADLWDLHAALIQFETALEDEEYHPDVEGKLQEFKIDLCELPVFGGDSPKSTVEVWSWDEDNLLMGVGPSRDWEIVDRV